MNSFYYEIISPNKMVGPLSGIVPVKEEDRTTSVYWAQVLNGKIVAVFAREEIIVLTV